MRILVRSLLLLVCIPLSASIAAAKSPADYWTDSLDYVAAPLHWDAADWRMAGGALAGIGAAYALDSSVRDHFAPSGPLAVANTSPTRDVLPLAVLLVGTVAAGAVSHDGQLTGTGLDMGEAVVLGTLDAQVIKLATGRQRPDKTTRPGRFGHGGDSFPSGHATAAFAAAQVLADEIPREKWGWRVLAYGLAASTAYLRMDSNAHWLSDTVAGAALGMAAGRFVSNRARNAHQVLSVGIEPLDRGAMVTFKIDIK